MKKNKITLKTICLSEVLTSLKDLKDSKFYNSEGEKKIQELLLAFRIDHGNIDDNAAKDLIYFFFKTARKDIEIESSDPTRPPHMLSTYLLGLWFYYNFKPIRNAVNSSIVQECNLIEGKRTENKIFLYIWFLICLGHDLKEDSWDAISESERNELQKELFHMPTLVPPQYMVGINQYLDYRNKKEHGILGGIDLYRKIKNSFTNHSQDDHFWHPETLKNDANVACWAIICHNLWTAQDTKTCKIYKEKGLNFLLPCEAPHISLEKHPFLFLLSIVDTLEPLKRDISLNDRHIVYQKDICFGSEVFQEKNRDLSAWLKIEKKDTHKILPLYYLK